MASSKVEAVVRAIIGQYKGETITLDELLDLRMAIETEMESLRQQVKSG